jgi:putative FmdB family regulatory protein
MPIYEYICDDCATRYEKLVRSDGDAIACPKCGSARHTLQLSVFSAGRSNGSAKSAESTASSACACNPRGCGCQ